MKQIDLSKQTKSRYPDTNSSRWRLWCMMLLALLATNASLLAQVSWVNGYPAWDANSETLTIGGDEGKLEVYFTTSQEITNAAVEFTLPANISYSGIENVNTAIAYNAPTISGQKVTVKVSSNGGTLASGSTVRFFLKLKAKCGAENGTTITVQTLTGTSPVGTPGAATVQAQSPSFTIDPVAASVDYDAADEFKSLGYKLKATNRDAKSFKLILTVDEFTTLKTFDWGGTTITPAMSNSNKTYTLTLTDLSSTEKTLSFEGASSRLGTHVVTPSIQYCTVETGFPTITLALPSVAGTPTLSHIGTNYVKSLTDDTEVDPWDIHMDGSTKNMVRAEFKNVGTADGYDLSAKFERYSSYSFLDTANIYYQIGGGSRTKLLKEHIKVSRVVENSVDYGYFGAHTGKEPVSVVLTLPKAEFLSIGETITFWIPTTNGKTYENEGKDVYFDYSTSVIKGFSSTLYANNEAGENKVAAEKIASIPYFGAPHFRELPAKLTIKPNEIKTQTIRIASGSIAASNKGKLKVYLQLPSWLKLVEPADGSFVWSSLDGTTVQSPESSDLTGKTPYRIYTGFADGEGLLTFTYTTDGSFSSSDSDQDGVISYYIDYDYNGQILDKISQVFQPVTLLCKEEGVVFEKLSLHRITRGLIDSNEDHIPDSNTPALDNEIDHTMYMIDDEGEIHWKARVLESSAYLYFPVTANGIAMQSGQRIDLKTAEVKVKRGGVDASYEVEVVNKTTTEFYLLVKAGATPFAAGDIIDVSLPFVATTASGAAKSFVSECFVSNMLINDPLNSKEDPARKGKDTKSQEIGVYDLNNALVDCSNNVYTFNDSGEKIWTTYANIFHNSPRSPYFKNEVRRHAYPGILSFELPDGYTLTNTSIKVRKGGGDAHGPAEKMLPPSSNSGNKYEYDFSSLYDLSYISGSGLDADKWILPDDRWVHYFYISVQATKGAVLGESTVKMKLTRKVPGKADVVQTINVTFNYNGTATQLSGLPAELPYFGSELTIPVATVGNPNQATLDKVWLYVEGNVENVKFGSTSGSGHEGRWYSVGSMGSGTTQSTSLTFDYQGRTDGLNINDTITVYTVSDFGDGSFTDPTGLALNVNDLDHVGARKRVVIVPGKVKATGSLSATTSLLTYNTPYNLEAVIDSRVSQSALKNPVMTITLPKGQSYQTGTLSLDYAGVTYDKDNSSGLAALDALLLSGDNADPAGERTLVFDLKELLGVANINMPGSQTAGTDAERIATLTATFKPMCKTPLTGMRFNGELTAANLDNAVIKVFSSSLLPAIDASYTFSMAASLDKKAFNELQTTGTLTLTATKGSAPNAPLAAGDYIALTIPASMNVAGSPTVTFDGGAASAVTVTEESLDSEKRVLKLSLPLTDVNGDVGNNGFNKPIAYSIEIEYTANGQTLAGTPSQKVEAKYMSTAKFSPVCDASDAALAQDEVKIAILTASENPYNRIVGETVTLSITSTDFDGSWYPDASSASPIASTTLTPTTPGTTTYYVSAILSGDATDYGRVPVDLIVYPSLAFTVTDFNGCGVSSKDLSELVDGDMVTDASNTNVLKYYESDQINPLGSTTVTAAGTYYVQSETSDGVLKGDMKSITVTFNPAAAISADLDDQTKVSKTVDTTTPPTENLTVTASSGTGITYQWYKSTTNAYAGTALTDDTAYAGATTADLTITFNTTAVTGFYYLVVTDGCGNEVRSKIKEVEAFNIPADVVLATGITSPKEYCGVVTSGDNLWDMIDHTDLTVTYHYNTTGATDAYTSEVNATTPVQLVGGTTYYLKANNGAGGLSATATELQVVVNTSVNAAIAFKDKITTSETIITPNSIVLKASGAATSGTTGTYYQFYKGTDPLGSPQTSDEYTVTASSANVGTDTYSVQIVNADGFQTGICGTLESPTTVSITVIDKPNDVELPLTHDAGKTCGTTKDVTLYDLITNKADYENTITFEYNTDGSGTRTVLGKTDAVAVPVGTTTYYVWAKRGATPSTTAGEVAITVAQYTAITLGTLTGTSLEAAAGTTGISAGITVTGTSGDTNSSNGYDYYLYDSSTATMPVASNDNGSFTVTVSAPSLTEASSTGYKEYTYYVSAAGACDESAKEAVTVKVYPEAAIEANTTAPVEFCTDNTSLSSAKLADYLTDALRTQWFDYTYDVSGAATATNQSLDANTPLLTSEGTYTYTLRATNRLSGSTAATATLTVKIAIPIALSPITTPQNLEGAGSISLIANPTAGTPVSFEWYKDAVKQSETSGTLTFNYGHTDVNTAFTTNTYYAKALGAIACADAQTNNVVVNVYPTPTLSLATTTDAYCEDNAVLTAGIDLWSYITTPNTTWFTYTYSGNGVTDGALAAGTVTIPTKPGTYTYTIKAVNKLATSTLEATETITIKVDRQTKITKQPTSVVVTEWDAFTLSVEAVAEGAITYQWEKWNTYLQVFETISGATSATYVVNRSVAKDAGLYRVVVTGGKGTACGKKVIPSDEVNVQVNPNGLCQITYASSEEGELVITDTDGNVITSGTYVVPGTKVKAMATARTAGYDLWQLVANGTVIDNNSTIEIAGHTHFFAHFTLDGKNPNPGVGNVEVTDGSQIWTNKGYVHILTEKPCKARIITFTGRVLIDRAISEGETQIYMPEGLYIVTLSDGTREKVSVKY